MIYVHIPEKCRIKCLKDRMNAYLNMCDYSNDKIMAL